jgi:hypothetical protein
MDYPSTYQVMFNIVKWNSIEQFSDLNPEQRISLFETFLKETDAYILRGRTIPVSLAISLLNLSAISRKNLDLTEDQITDLIWSDLRPLFNQIFDEIKDKKETDDELMQMIHFNPQKPAVNNHLSGAA